MRGSPALAEVARAGGAAGRGVTRMAARPPGLAHCSFSCLMGAGNRQKCEYEMNDRLLALKLFVRLAHSGSFSQAGKDVGLSQPSASRLIAAFEKEIGIRLFERSTRAVSLTGAGADYLARIEPALAMLDEAGQAARGKGGLSGSLRIAVAPRHAHPAIPPGP